MLYLFRPLPSDGDDFSEWMPFIENGWFRKNFMFFVYLLIAMLIKMSQMAGVWNFPNHLTVIAVCLGTFVVHELLHILVIFTKGDLSLTLNGFHFWITSSAELGKGRFWLFMTLPFIMLTLVPAVVSLFFEGFTADLLKLIAWFNAIIAASDEINSFLILIKPKGSVFWKGYYK